MCVCGGGVGERGLRERGVLFNDADNLEGYVSVILFE